MCLKIPAPLYRELTPLMLWYMYTYVYYVSMQVLIVSVQNDYGKVSLKSVNADKSFFAHAISDPKLGKEEPYTCYYQLFKLLKNTRKK